MRMDKNLGPALIERSWYITLAFKDHLSHRNIYQRLTRKNAENVMTETYRQVKEWLQWYKLALTKSERKFLTRTLQLRDHRLLITFPQFYLLAKIHKTLLSTQPIVSISGSLLHGLGCWADHKLQPYGRSISSFIESSLAYLQRLCRLQERQGPLPPTPRFFTCDTMSMYTNIPTNTALDELRYLP